MYTFVSNTEMQVCAAIISMTVQHAKCHHFSISRFAVNTNVSQKTMGRDRKAYFANDTQGSPEEYTIKCWREKKLYSIMLHR